jgi:DNA mismatch endonuclease (patch repair protein)
MKANRRTDTKPELALRHALHRLGYRYRKDYRLDLDSGRRVRPDIAFTARKVAVFVDGCFWHACPEHGSKPRANEWYWGPKLIKNVERDRVNDAALILAGWTVIRLWEHVPIDEAVTTVITALTATGPAGPTTRLADARSAVADSGEPCACSCLRRFRRWPRLCRPARSVPARCPGSPSRLRCVRRTRAATRRSSSTPR